MTDPIVPMSVPVPIVRLYLFPLLADPRSAMFPFLVVKDSLACRLSSCFFFWMLVLEMVLTVLDLYGVFSVCLLLPPVTSPLFSCFTVLH